MPTLSPSLADLIHRYYGDACRILDTRRAADSRAHLFVVETSLRGRQLRVLATIGRTRELMEHSAMDLMQPERLVFPYERLMLAALAIADVPGSVLLLGLGGGAMTRHLEAYFPKARLTVVERDRTIIALARSFFHFRRPVLRADAEDVLAETRDRYDAILVDCYDAGGAAPFEASFWENCRAALTPGGCIAVNWAGGWSGQGLEGPHLQRVRQIMAPLPGSFLVVERGPRGNIVQFAPAAQGFRLGTLPARVESFARANLLPREDRDVLKHCDIRRRYAARVPAGKLARNAGRGGDRGRVV